MGFFFHILLCRNQTAFDKVIDKVKELYEDPKNHIQIGNPKVEDKGVAMFSEDGEYYRCVVRFYGTVASVHILFTYIIRRACSKFQ